MYVSHMCVAWMLRFDIILLWCFRLVNRVRVRQSPSHPFAFFSFWSFQAELEKGIKAGLARITELEQRAAAVAEAGGGDVDGEDPVRNETKRNETGVVVCVAVWWLFFSLLAWCLCTSPPGYLLH